MGKSEASSVNSLIVGILSGGITQFAFVPIDFLKVRSQALGRGEFTHLKNSVGVREFGRIINTTIKNEGVKGFFAGSGASIFGAGMSWGLYFVAYNKLKTIFATRKEKHMNSPNKHAELSTVELLTASTISGIFSSIVMHPVWLLKTRIQLNGLNDNVHQYKNAFDGIKKIIKAEGIEGLFIGLPASLFMVSHGIIFFLMYDKMKYQYFKKRDCTKLSPHAALVMSSVAKLAATMVSYPFSVAKTRVQDQQNKYHQIQYNGVIDAMKQMWRKEGLLSFYRGIVPALIRTIPSGSITMIIYELLNNLIENYHEKKYEV